MAYIGKEVSVHYARFRPVPPKKLIKHALTFLSKKEKSPFHLALDVGCGSGQFTRLLSPHFKQVIGIDVSRSQVEEARRTNSFANIDYRFGSASEFPLESRSVDLISTCQALHWFDAEEFFQEVNRVLKDTGVLAVAGYTYPEPIVSRYSTELFELVQEFFKENEQLWHKGNKSALNRYLDIEFPYKSICRIDPIPVDIEGNFNFVLEHLLSRSGIQNLKKKDPARVKSIMEDFQSRFQRIIGSNLQPEDIPMNVRFNYFLILCSKSEHGKK